MKENFPGLVKEIDIIPKNTESLKQEGHKQAQGGCQNEEKKKYGPNERTEQSFRERTKRHGDKQSIRCRVQNTGDQDAPGTHWALQRHKKDPGRNEGCTMWNKEKFTGNQSGVDEAKNQINDLEHKEAKNNHTEQREEQRIQKS